MFVAIMLIFSIILTGCTQNGGKEPVEIGGNSGGDEKVYKLGIALEKYDDNFMSYLRRAIETAAEPYEDIELILNDAQRDQARMNEQIDVMISRGVDALAVNLVNVEAAPSVIDKAKTENIPVVFFNKDPGEDVMNSYELCYYVGTALPESGIMQGKMVADAWLDNPEF